MLLSGKPGEPCVTQDGKDGDEIPGHITAIREGTVIGFKYFDFDDVRTFSIWTRGYADGRFQVRTSPEGEILAELPLHNTNLWTKYTADIRLPRGKSALYLTYAGGGNPMLRSIAFE